MIIFLVHIHTHYFPSSKKCFSLQQMTLPFFILPPYLDLPSFIEKYTQQQQKSRKKVFHVFPRGKYKSSSHSLFFFCLSASLLIHHLQFHFYIIIAIMYIAKVYRRGKQKNFSMHKALMLLFTFHLVM